MTAPRLEINLDKIHHNARALVEALARRSISVTGVTKAMLGSPDIARTLVDAGITAVGDSRVENIQAMRCSRVPAPMMLIRSPMLSQVNQVVRHCDTSFNTELDVLSALSAAATEAGKTHGVVLMVELGDLREGVMPGDLENTVRETLRFPNIALRGIGTNLACHSGVAPDAKNMAELSALADSIEARFGLSLGIVSGGNSGSLEWALGCSDTGRINNLRLGESILLGRESLRRSPLDGLHTDAVTLVAEVIELKVKPSQPRGTVEQQTAFGKRPPATDRGFIPRAILAIGHQDTDPYGLLPPPGITVLGASSDHLVTDSSGYRLDVGSEVPFELNYSALVRAMTSPFVAKAVVAKAVKARSVPRAPSRSRSRTEGHLPIQREDRSRHVAIGQPVVAWGAQRAAVAHDHLSGNRFERGTEVLHRS